MKVTPTKNWGPIAGGKVAGKTKIYQPGEAMDVDDVRGAKLISGGKAELVHELTLPSYTRARPVPQKPPIRATKKKGKKGESKDANSD
jgi:hypothetical protein